jgi:hypothetical protein
MPGAFAGDIVEQQHTDNRDAQDEEDEEESEEDEPAPILPIRIARGLMNMFWGGRADIDEDDSDLESEDDAPTNTEGDHAVD